MKDEEHTVKQSEPNPPGAPPASAAAAGLRSKRTHAPLWAPEVSTSYILGIESAPEVLAGHPPMIGFEEIRNTDSYKRAMEEIAGGLMEIERLSRRNFLKLSAKVAGGLALGAFAGVLGAPSTARADRTVETGKFVFPRLQFVTVDGTGKHWDISPQGDAILRRELKRLTNVNVSMEPKVVRLSDFDEMCLNPFVFMTAGGSFRLPPNEEQNLHEFLERGGFILADDCMGVGGGNDTDAFFRCYLNLVNKLYPDNPMRKIPYDHEIFHNYFDFKEGCPHMQGVPHGAYGLFEPGTGRIMTWLSPGDIHCGWVCSFWGMEKNMEAIKMGINVIIYFLSH